MSRRRGRFPCDFRLLAALAAVALASALAGCGGDDGDEPTADFPAVADDTCAQIASDLADVRGEAGPPASAGDAVQMIELQLPVREDGLADLQALRAPAELVAPWTEYVDLQEQKIAALEDALAAAQGERQTAYNEAQAKFEDLSDRARGAAEDAGLDNCSELLPSAGQEDVLGAVEELLTSQDSKKVCNELLTKRFVETVFGDVENCEKERGLPTAASLQLLDIGGVAATWAFVDVEIVDYLGQSEQQRIELIFKGEEDEKGRWLVDYRDRLSAPEEDEKSSKGGDEQASGDEAGSGETTTGETTTGETTTGETTTGETTTAP